MLKIKYKDERVFVLKNEDIFHLISPGITKSTEESQHIVDFINKNGFFEYRFEAEFNSAFKQIIPYIVAITKDNEIFTMKRIAGDSRLIGNISIGIGGHVNPIDFEDNPLQRCLEREIAEEVLIDATNFYSLELKGFIYDDTDSIGRDHIALIVFLNLKNNKISVKEIETLKGFISTKEELVLLRNQMENWTRLIFDNLL